MQIVIEIPDIVKTHCDGGGILQTIDIIKLKNAVAHGTPLPERHERLIDADAFLAWLIFKGYIDNIKCGEVAKAIRKTTIIPATKEGESK